MKPTIISHKFLILAITLVLCGRIFGQQSMQVTPSKFIAYSLYNFSKFIDWPSDAKKSNFQICVVGDKAVYNELLKLAENKKQGNSNYQITFYKSVDEIKEFSHIIYLSNLYSGKVKSLASEEIFKGALFVTEREGMTKQGSAISFITDSNGMMGFEIAKSNTEKNNLTVQKQLERLASKVI
jgi:phosphoglycerol transferase MdoB-like AlkP superfamily enzyme